MPIAYQHYRTFIASPGDVAKERSLATEVLGKINRTFRDTLRISLEAIKWEDAPPLAPKLPDERIQDLLNQEVRKANFFILILGRRYGSTEPGQVKSNTEREIDTVLSEFARKPQLRILAYFKNIGPNTDSGPQEVKLRELQQRLASLGLSYRTYTEPEDFKEQLTHDLYEISLKIRLSPHKKQVLDGFWKFCDTSEKTLRVSVVFPPFQRYSVREGSDPNFWLQRLTAPLALEDHKAIQKIEKHFQMLGLRDYRVSPCTDLPAEIDQMNRVWLCVPRNPPALASLSRHTNLRFDMKPSKSSERPSGIRWKNRNGRWHLIQSPMGSYIDAQRKEKEISGEWHGSLGKIIAKDYAVLARLARPEKGEDDESHLRDFYLAGIRGLGTWGAAWFIDRKYNSFREFSEEQNIELLLEVTFGNSRITAVDDVSDMPISYFKENLSANKIASEISRFRNH